MSSLPHAECVALAERHRSADLDELVAIGAEAQRERDVAALRAIPIDDLRDAGFQCDSYHEAMRALFIATLERG